LRVSIVIPAFNAQEFIAPAIRSALGQTLPPAEILVVDNGSGDRTAEIARGFGGPVRVLEERRPGASRARLTGADVATGEALMFLDADDLIGPTVLEELAGALAGNDGAVACCPWRRYELDGQCWRARPPSCAPRRAGQDALTAWLGGWYHPPCAVLWSADAYRRSGGWNPAISVDDDGDVMMRALARGVPLLLTRGGTAYYRRLPGDAVSLSGRRLTPEGLRSRLAVLEAVEQTLRLEGKAQSYRRPLAKAYLRLSEEARETAPELAAHAEALARRNRGRWSARGGGAASIGEGPVGAARPARRPEAIPQRSPEAAAEPSAPDPLVSVVIPTYNRAALAGRALDSVLSQDFGRLEALVVDDGSNEDIRGMVAARDDERVRYLRQPENRGVAAARNRGIREARAPLIAFLDSDDQWLPGKVARQVELASRRPDWVGFFYTGAIERWEHGDEEWIPDARGLVLEEMLHRNPVHVATSSVLVRREVFETVGLFDESLPANEDHELWTRIAAFFGFDFVAEPLIVYTHPPEGSAADRERRSQNFAANMAARLAFLDLHGAEAQRAGVKYLFHLDCARRHLESPSGDVRRARSHLLRAIASRPGEPRLLMWFAFSLLPPMLRRRAAPGLKALRSHIPSRLWLGAARGA